MSTVVTRRNLCRFGPSVAAVAACTWLIPSPDSCSSIWSMRRRLGSPRAWAVATTETIGQQHSRGGVMGCCWALHAACACRAQASLISSVTASPRRRLIRSNVGLRPASLGPLSPPPLMAASCG